MTTATARRCRGCSGSRRTCSPTRLDATGSRLARRRRLGLPLDLAAEDGYTEVEQRLSPRAALSRHLERLAPHERDALELRIVEELSYEEVAERLEIRPAAARLRVSRALRRLASNVPKEEV